jgi:hypothetical protein
MHLPPAGTHHSDGGVILSLIGVKYLSLATLFLLQAGRKEFVYGLRDS